MRSIRWKLIFIYVALIFIVLILTGTFIIVSFRNQEEVKAREELKQYSSSIIDQIISQYVGAENFQQGFELNNFSIGGSRFQGAILDSSGATVAGIQVTDTDTPNYQSPVIISALNGEESFVAGRKHPDEANKVTVWMEYAEPVQKGDEKYIVYVRINAEQIYENIAGTTNIFVLSMVVALFLTAVLGAVFSGTLTGPIRILTSKAKELAQGNLDQKIPVASKDEIGQLTESFNFMASELKKSINDIQSEKNKIEIILYNMTDGVLAFDGNLKLIHANNSSEDLLGSSAGSFSEFSGLMKFLFPDSSFDVDNIDSFNESTIAIGPKYITATFNSYKGENGMLEGIVIVLQDITKHRKLDDMRKDFIANVSHEIRTPLTNIKSYAETLMEGAIDNKEAALDFLGVINGEVDRMTHIVKDLLELSSLDSKQMLLDIAKVNLNELIGETIKKQVLTAQKQSKQIIFDDQQQTVFINVDRQRISQVLTNIITNSIKYSNEGSIIEIKVEQTKFYTRIYIKDNGIGIPKEDLRSIFDRFYRVDKARSRGMGGTGLGLSIAKEIMETHGGGISALSEVGKGTTMILRFPEKDYLDTEDGDEFVE